MAQKKTLTFWLKVALILFVVSSPLTFSAIYRGLTRPNPKTVIVGGFEGGRYHEVVTSLVDELNKNSLLNKSETTYTKGSYQNLEMLEKGEADFAVFQSGSDRTEDLDEDHRDIRFVSNLFPEVAHLVVRSDVTDEQLEELDFSSIAIGLPTSGDYRVGKALLSHLNLDQPAVTVTNLNYVEIKTAFEKSEIEIAILAVGIGAEIIQQLIEDCNCRLVSLPSRDAFLAKHVAYISHTIPRGSYSSGNRKSPATDLETIAVNAQLLTHRDISSGKVQELLKTLNRRSFLKVNRLRKLFVDGQAYATRQPEFPVHTGATTFYDPRFRPVLNPDFVEATEGIRSFVFSGLIGIFFLVRWLRYRAERSQAHQLDEYIHRLLAIEQEQMALDGDYSKKQLSQLEKFLDEITELRREALMEFTAHDLKDDPAIECFISMSHALSEKIYSKLTRDAIKQKS